MSDKLTKPPGKRQIQQISALIGLGIFLLCSATYRFVEPQIVQDIEGRLLDARFKLRGQQPVSDTVAIVAIDDASLQALGRWPWSRTRIAELIEAINAAGATAIGLDIVFAEPSSDDMLQAFRESVPFPDDMSRQYDQFAATRAPDKRLANTLFDSGNVVTGNYFYTNPQAAEQVQKSAATDQLVQRSAVSAVKTKTDNYAVTTAMAVATNIPDIAMAGAGSGFFNTEAGGDGVVRYMPLVIRYKQDLYPSLALKLLSVVMSNAPVIVHVEEYGLTHISVGSHEVATDEMGKIVLNYAGPEKTIATWSAKDLLEGTLPPMALKGRIVLLGVPAVGVSDVRATPFAASFPGVEIQATALDNIILQNPIVITNLANFTDIVTMFVLVMLLVIVLPRITGMFMRSLAASAILLVYIIFNLYLFASHGLWVSLAYPLIAWLMAYSLLSVYLGVIVEHSYSTVRSAFKSYLHPGLVDQLTQNPELLTFGGEQKYLTVMFSDIRNFTNLSETLTPQQLSRFLRCYMDPMTEEVFNSRGTLDKYIGDAVMAIFGSPYPSEIHAENACRCALNMIARLDSVKECCPDLERLFPIKIGIGIHTGDVVVGNLGSSYRFTYTVLGDNVNLSARLEGMSKAYGVNIVISEVTRNEVGDKFVCRELDRVRVKGKEVPIKLFELIGETVDEGRQEFLRQWQTALDAYKAQQWDEAATLFGQLQESSGPDKSCELYSGRSEKYSARPPSTDWDGVYVHTEK